MLLPVPEAAVPRTRNWPLCDISPGAEGAAGTAAVAALAHGGLTLAADTSHGQRCCCSGSSSCWPRAGLCRACGTPASKRRWALGGSLGNISGVSWRGPTCPPWSGHSLPTPVGKPQFLVDGRTRHGLPWPAVPAHLVGSFCWSFRSKPWSRMEMTFCLQRELWAPALDF